MPAPTTITLTLTPGDAQWLVENGYAQFIDDQLVLGQESELVMRALLIGAVYAESTE